MSLGIVLLDVVGTELSFWTFGMWNERILDPTTTLPAGAVQTGSDRVTMYWREGLCCVRRVRHADVDDQDEKSM